MVRRVLYGSHIMVVLIVVLIVRELYNYFAKFSQYVNAYIAKLCFEELVKSLLKISALPRYVWVEN